LKAAAGAERAPGGAIENPHGCIFKQISGLVWSGSYRLDHQGDSRWGRYADVGLM